MPAVSELGRRQRRAFLAFRRAVSIAFGAAPSIACDSIRLPPQSRTAMATVVLFFCAQAVQPSTRPRAPAELMILMVRVGADAGAASALAATEIASNVANEAKEARMRMVFLPIMAFFTLQVPRSTVERGRLSTSLEYRFSRLGFFIRRTHVGEAIYQKARHGFIDRPGRPAA